eukprot:TRINITY_DN2370_c0_g1_i1.p2 TRINITY_DN2370_c0_g1~~TRINITY_DN2370_c0_g1_i1.p2  ORF type:complete len:114 (+),score=5.30 TRINITY_DN2370_c0_g1_i1:74-415(+)
MTAAIWVSFRKKKNVHQGIHDHQGELYVPHQSEQAFSSCLSTRSFSILRNMLMKGKERQESEASRSVQSTAGSDTNALGPELYRLDFPSSFAPLPVLPLRNRLSLGVRCIEYE